MDQSSLNLSQFNNTFLFENDSNFEPESNNPSEDKFHLDSKFKLILGFLGLWGFFVVLANSLVFFLYWRKPLLRKTSNTILISLAVSDLSTGLLAIPLVISCSLSSAYTDPKCFAMDICQRFLSLSTILHLFAATMERYLRILKPLHSIAMVTKRRIVGVLSLIWCLSFGASVVQLTWTDLQDATSDKAKNIEVVYSMTVLCVLVLFPCVAMVVAFTRMLLVLRRKNSQRNSLPEEDAQVNAKRIKRRKVERRSVFVYSLMTLTYAVGWFPYFVTTYLMDVEQDSYDTPLWLDTLMLYLKFATAFFNPLLYTLFKFDFQSALRSLNINTSHAAKNPATSQFQLSSLSRSHKRDKNPSDSSLL